MPDNVLADIRAFIVDAFLFGDETGAPDADASLIENGVIDSTGVLELVAFLEQTYGLQVGDADIVPENLDSIARIAAFVAGKRDRTAA
jgi:acyl carrier protein